MVPSESDAPKSESENSESEPEITVAEFVEFSGSNEVLAGNGSISDEIVAELVEFSDRSDRSHRPDRRFLFPPPIQKNLDNIAAKGGALGAMVLGVWSLGGAFVTSWSAINAMLGLMLGLWGLSSRHVRWAAIGIGLCAISLILCLYGGAKFSVGSEFIQVKYVRGDGFE